MSEGEARPGLMVRWPTQVWLSGGGATEWLVFDSEEAANDWALDTDPPVYVLGPIHVPASTPEYRVLKKHARYTTITTGGRVDAPADTAPTERGQQ